MTRAQAAPFLLLSSIASQPLFASFHLHDNYKLQSRYFHFLHKIRWKKNIFHFLLVSNESK